MNTDRFRIGKVYVSVTNPDDIIVRIEQAVANGVNNYICVASMRTILVGNKDEDYRNVVNNSMVCTPDGMPLVWMAKAWGLKHVERTSGPDLFMKLLQDKTNGLKHFLLGDTEETLVAIKEKFSDSLIMDYFSPPFCKVDEFDYEDIAARVKRSGANIVWVALQAPKQDIFSKKLLQYVEHTLCIGVGAAFRFSLGEYKFPSKTAQKLGLTGFFWRKWDWPLIKQYFVAAGLVVKCWTSIIFSRMLGKKYYD